LPFRLTDDGWPVVAPEGYAGVPQQPIAEEDIIGTWEEITMKYQYQTMQTSYEVIFKEDHTLGGALDGSWSYDEANQTLRVNGTKLIIDNAWNWEASPRQTTITYAGLTDSGRSIWGKKIKDQRITAEYFIYPFWESYCRRCFHVPVIQVRL